MHFANEAIDEIIKRENCCAIAMDISGFFDNLNHKIIKKQWLKVLGVPSMPSDHYTIYKNITKYRYIDAKKLEDVLKIKLKDLQKQNKELRKKNAKANIRLLKNNTEFRNLIIPNLETPELKPLELERKGIPQGTTISDVIANMYLIDFDKEISNLAKEHNWYYRRYSDDILIVCNLEEEQEVIGIIKELITKECKLEIKDEKTLFSNFRKTDDAQECTTYKYDEKQNNYAVVIKPFEYLGLSFNGTEKRIRASTLSKFYQKLKERIKKEVNIAKNKLFKKGVEEPTFKQLYKKTQFTRIYDDYLGKYSSKNYQKEKSACKSLDDRKKLYDDWRNFYSYVELVAKVTDDEKNLEIFNSTIKWIKNKVKEECNKVLES